MKYGIRFTLALAFVGVVGMAAVAFGQHGTPVAEKSGAPAIEKRAQLAEKRARFAEKHGRPGHKGDGFKRRMVTGEFKVQTDGGFATVRFDQGTVTAVGDDSVTLKRADGETVTVPVTAETRIGKDGERAELSDVEVGDLVRAVRRDEGDGFETRRLMVRTPEAVKD